MILVTGATGNVGGELVRQLVAANQPVRALVRSQDQNAMPTSVETFIGDLNRPESLSTALRDVRGVFLLGGYGNMPGVLAEIRRAGVGSVVLLSSRSAVGGDSSNAIVSMWMVSEAAVRSSGVPWTILQPSGFMSNALRWLPQIRAGDVVRAPFADVPIAAIDPYDIAGVAAVALTSKGHTSRSHVLTAAPAGPSNPSVGRSARKRPSFRRIVRGRSAGGTGKVLSGELRGRVLALLRQRRIRRLTRPHDSTRDHRPTAAHLRAMGKGTR